MPLVWKDLLAPGTYRLTDGRTVTYDADECRRLAAQGNRMLAAGLRCPLILDHDEHAAPVYMSVSAPRRRLARDCVGEAARYGVGPGGRLRVLVDVDADAVPKLRRVAHVSPTLDWDWPDERGRVWKGLSVQHIAATPRPIQRDQDRFDLSHEAPGRPGRVPATRAATRPGRVSLSHATREGGPMADEAEDLETETETPAPEGEGGGGSGDGKAAQIQSILDSLAALGVDLTGVDTITDLKSLDHALKVAAAVKGGAGDEDEGGETAGGGAGNGDATTGGGTMPPPVMMSHGEKSALDKLAASTAKDLQGRIDRLFKSGRVNGPVQRALHGKLKAASLSHQSYDPKTHELKPLAVVTEIEAYEQLPAGRFAKENKAGSLSHGETVAGGPPGELDPNAAETAVVKRQEELAQRYSATKK